MKRHFLVVLVALIAAAVVACTESTSSPVDTSQSIDSITPEDLPSMVLDQVGVVSEFPDLVLDWQESGYRDNVIAAENTIDPDDSALVMAARGRLDGYENGFIDPQALTSDQSSTGRPYGAGSTVELMDGEESARAYLRIMVEEFRRYQDADIEGVTFDGFEELAAPDLGSDAIAIRVSGSTSFLNVTVYTTIVSWARGPIVATVGTGAFDDTDLLGALTRLALLMDQRIQEVLPEP